MRPSPRIRGGRAQALISSPSFGADCAFCGAGIRLVDHVSMGCMRVGQDYGDAE